ncbi:Hsp20/alpha crystallin family protein [Desulfovibrio aminophilus]|nr:Hsp20/alpha crystallin family protein [Desulfovibrio aminophilus]MCM0753852.1 Hsp20/alpha crystallin family protein [Desulfovibrio aminophilus]
MVLDFNTLYSFPDRFDRLMQEFLQPVHGESRRMAYPPLNISEDDENVYVRAEIPGVEITDMEITLTDKTLVIKGERKPEQGKYFRQERPAGQFQRVVQLNVQVDRDAVKAALTDGILVVTLPKTEDIKPRRVSIDVG